MPIALLRNSTLAGSTMTLITGSRLLSASHPTMFPSHVLIWETTGAMPNTAATASVPPTMPAEYMFTSISKPGLILPCQIASTFFMIHAASGPMTIAPRNIGTVLPTMIPTVAMLPTTPPRSP